MSLFEEEDPELIFVQGEEGTTEVVSVDEEDWTEDAQ